MSRSSDPEEKTNQKRTDRAKKNRTDLFFPMNLFDPDQGKAIVFGVYDYEKPTPYAREIKNARCTVALPIPPELSDSSTLNYNEFEGGFAARSAKIAGKLSQSTQNISTLLSGQVDIQTVKDAVFDGAYNVGYGLLSQLLGDEYSLATSYTGQALNPYNQSVFQSVSLKEHQFQYAMIARNQEESVRIFDIIETLKEEAHPSMENISMLSFPSVFEFKFLPSSIDRWLYQPNASALVNVTASYNNQSHPVFFRDTGAPVEVMLSLQFQELVFDTRETLRTKRDEKETIPEGDVIIGLEDPENGEQ